MIETITKQKLQIKDCLKITTRHIYTINEVVKILEVIDDLYTLFIFSKNLEFKENEIRPTPEHLLYKAMFGENAKEIKTPMLYLNNIDYQMSRTELSNFNIGLNYPLNPIISEDFQYQLREYIKIDSNLRILNISANSPIQINLLGLADIIEKIKDFIIDIINIPTMIKSRKLDNRIKEQDLLQKTIENDIREEDRKQKSLETLEKYLDLEKRKKISQYSKVNKKNTAYLDTKVDEVLEISKMIKKIEIISSIEI